MRFLADENLDFAVGGAGAEGVVLVRFPAAARQLLGKSIADLVATRGDALRGSFTVVKPGQIRITPVPPRSR